MQSIEQKEKLSSLMDGELVNSSPIVNEDLKGEFVTERFIDLINEDDDLQACWHRYHIARDAMHGQLHDSAINLLIANAVANAIADDNRYELSIQPKQADVIIPNVEQVKTAFINQNSLWNKIKDSVVKMSQVGLAACVTLVIIAGVQYYQNESTPNNISMLNTVPVGVSLAPVGGITEEPKLEDQQLFEKRQYDKIRLLVQDYELQKRLNAH